MKPVISETIEHGVKIITFLEEKSDTDRMVNNEKNILFLGNTGVGKTTLVDALFNYLAGVCLNDDFRFQITDKCDKTDQTKWQTETTTCYTLPTGDYLSNTCSLNIIDTPGFNNTDNKYFQMTIVKQIKALLTSKITTLHAICIVSPLLAFRLTETLKSVFNGIFELFGHDVGDIVYCVSTFNDGGIEPVLKTFKYENIKLKAHFKFCNSHLFNEISEDEAGDAHKHWLNNSINFKSLLDQIYQSEGKSVKLTRDVLRVVENLEIQLKGLQSNVRESAQRVINLRKEFRLLRENKEKLNRGEHFEYYEEVPKNVYNRTSSKKTCLNCKTCKRTCHENCWAKFEISYRTCEVFTSRICTLCKCGTDNHVNESAIYKQEFEKVLRTDEDLKKKYANAEETKSKLKDELQKLDKIIKRIKCGITELKYKALCHKNITIEDYIVILYRKELSCMKPGYEDRADIYVLLQENIELEKPALKLLD